jgi:hypothetical protein
MTQKYPTKDYRYSHYGITWKYDIKNLKQSRNRAGVAQRIPGGLGTQIP